MAGYETRKREHTLRYPAHGTLYGSPYPWETPLNGNPDLVFSQETTSFRTHGPEKDISLPTKADLKVVYNPFKENYPHEDADGKPWDTGHEFFTRKTSERISHPKFHTYGRPGYNSEYSGPLVLNLRGGDTFVPSVDKMSDNDIKFYGSKAIKLTTPTQPQANTSQMIAELISDGLPISGGAAIRLAERFNQFRLVKGAGKLNWREYLSSIGDATLALKFGAEPLISDMVAIMTAVSTAAQRIEQWRRDSGKQVRRSMSFPEEVSTTVQKDYGYGSSLGVLSLYSYPYGFDNDAWSVTLTKIIRKKTWFSGAYMYYATVGETALDNIVRLGREADLILGLNISYETLWELAPWSWLVDWKANVGDAISNSTRFSADKLVLRYGYLMRETHAQYTISSSDITNQGNSIGTVWHSRSVVQKERYKATPYGFGLVPTDLSENQWSILAALGLSKGGRALP